MAPPFAQGRLKKMKSTAWYPSSAGRRFLILQNYAVLLPYAQRKLVKFGEDYAAAEMLAASESL